MKRLLTNARLRLHACMEDIDYRRPGDWTSRSSYNWRDATGSPGATTSSSPDLPAWEKPTWPAPWPTAPAAWAIPPSTSVSPGSFKIWPLPEADGSYPKVLKNLAKAKVLILDDLGLAPMSAQERRDLLEVIEDRHGSASTIVTAQLPVENWHENIRDPTIADAILDRLVHNAYKINLKGESMRKLRSSLTNQKDSEN